MAKIIDTKKGFKISAIVYAAVIIVGIVMSIIAGVKLDINFSGGTKISYSYEGEIAEKDFSEAVKTALDKEFTVSKNTSLAGDVNSYVITLAGKKSIAAETQENITKALTEKFKDNKIELYDSTSVSPTIAGTFFAKSLVAILITAVLVVVYVGIRFKKIGGVSAALSAFAALILDLLTAFFACVIFRLPIDSNFMAVVLTILGYSLNDTIVIYDRVRENRKLYPDMEISELVNMSISKVSIRNVVTSVTTFLAIITIVVVSEIYGLTSLRTFAIPMAFGVVSGAVSSLFIAGPLWVIWKNYKAKKAPKKAK